MRDSLPISISEITAIILLLASTVSVYINLLSKIQNTENIVKHLMYSIDVLKEKVHHHENTFDSLRNDTNRLNKQVELEAQQGLSDKDALLLHVNGLKELINHRAMRTEAQLNKLEVEYRKSIADVEAETTSRNKDMDSKVNELTNYLIKKSDFIRRDSGL